MYDLFQQNNAQQILDRIEKLKPSSQAQWGKMKVEQMLAHVAITLRNPFASNTKQRFIGKLLGGWARKSILSPQPFNKNSPTDPGFIIRDDREFEKEKANVIAGIKKFVAAGPGGITNTMHPFFGKFTAQNWAFLMHKHLDHHLQQFGV